MPETIISSDGVNIWTTSKGNGYPVMLCNGGPGCCDYLEPVAEMFGDAARVIRFEERGCGRSAPVPPYDIKTSLSDLENIREYYRIDRWIIGGHSWGSDLALFYALEHTLHVSGLICISGGRIHSDRRWYAEYKRREEE